MADESEFRPAHIRAWRIFRKMSLDELAYEANIDKGNLSKMERGEYPYRQPTFEKIAKALGVSPGRLIDAPPTDPTPLWDIWEKAPPEIRKQIEATAEALFKSSSRQ